jgi:hypothetical protein
MNLRDITSPFVPVLLFCLGAAGNALGADGALVFKLGAYSPGGQSELWNGNVGTFDLEVGDFNYLMGGIELDLAVASYLDVAVGFDGYSRRVDSNYRDFVREDGTQIQQSFKLKVLPITGGLQFLPLRRFRRLIPRVGAGAGLYYFDYQESGEFITGSSFQIVPGSFGDTGVVPGVHVSAGAEFMFSEGIDPGEGWFVFGQFRRHWASVELPGEFDHQELDLGGTELGFGVSLRF